jgi:hypothetical protein
MAHVCECQGLIAIRVAVQTKAAHDSLSHQRRWPDLIVRPRKQHEWTMNFFNRDGDLV